MFDRKKTPIMKKILHIPNYYPPHIGGIEDVCHTCVRLLSQYSDIRQMIVCFNDQAQTVFDTIENVEVIRCGVWKKISSQSISWSYAKLLKQTITNFKPDYIHFHWPNPFVGQIILRTIPQSIRLILHWHSDIVAQNILYRFIKPIETRLMQRAYKIIATSPNYIESSIPLSRFIAKTEVIPNVIDPSKFELTPTCTQKIEQIKQQYGKPIVLFLGRHVPYKGLQYLIEAAQHIKTDCSILIAGHGPLTELLKQQSRNLPFVEFIGRISNDDLPAYYHAADIFAFPSITKNEAFGIVLAEAMYCQKPAVTFTIPGSGVNWVNLNGSTGIECTNSDCNNFADALNKLLTNHTLRYQMGLEAKKRVEQLFTPAQILNKLYELYS